MKKSWGIFAAGLLFIILAACQGDDVVSKLGIVEDDIYINEFMGIQFQIPPGWRIASHEEMRKTFDFEDCEMFFLYRLDLEENYRNLFDEGILFFNMMSHSPETVEVFISVVSRIPEKTNEIDQDEIIQRIISSNMFLGDLAWYTTVYFRIDGDNLFKLFFNGSMTGDFTEPKMFLNELGAPRLEHKIFTGNQFI